MTRGAQRPRLRGITKFRSSRKQQITTRTSAELRCAFGRLWSRRIQMWWRLMAEFCVFCSLHGNDKVIRTRAITFIIAASASRWENLFIWSSVPVNSHRAGGGRNRPHPVTRHRNTGCCSERVAHFLCGLHDPLWLCRAHYVLARISSKCRCAECQREHDTCASNRRTAQATKPVSYCHAVIVIPFRILRKLI